MLLRFLAIGGIVLVILFSIFPYVVSFHKYNNYKVSTKLFVTPNSYQNLLRDALLKKSGLGESKPADVVVQSMPPPEPVSPVTNQPSTIPPLMQTAVVTNNQAKQAWKMGPEPKTARERASFKSKIPFSEEMYEVLKTTIEILTERKQSKKPISTDEALWLINAVEIIIDDANKYGPPERPIRTADE